MGAPGVELVGPVPAGDTTGLAWGQRRAAEREPPKRLRCTAR